MEAKHDILGFTALSLGALEGNESTVRLLLQHGANAGQTDKDGRTALHLAAQRGEDGVVGALVRKELLERKDAIFKQTALHMAARGGHESTVKVLLESGANPNALDFMSRTPRQYADDQGIDLPPEVWAGKPKVVSPLAPET